MLAPFPSAPALRRSPPRISIIITSHNYGRYLRRALATACEQSGADTEVIAVEDGSTDDSRQVLAAWNGPVRTILQDNLGQAAAFNAGVAASTGDVIVFLDADDELRPGIAAAVAEAFAERPDAARAVFRLEVVDGLGRPSGAVVPAGHLPLPAGDVRDRVLAAPDDLPWPPTSGNAWAAWALRRLMPLPVGEDKILADLLLHATVPLLGPVIALDCVGGAYRVHAANSHASDRLDVEASRRLLRWTARGHADVDRLAQELGYGRARPRSVTLAAHRLVSLRLGGDGHPVSGDSRILALGAGLRAACGRVDAPLSRRTAYAAWFGLVAISPRWAVRSLVAAVLQPTDGASLLRRLLRR